MARITSVLKVQELHTQIVASHCKRKRSFPKQWIPPFCLLLYIYAQAVVGRRLAFIIRLEKIRIPVETLGDLNSFPPIQRKIRGASTLGKE